MCFETDAGSGSQEEDTTIADPEFIQRGAEGDDVVLIQRALQELGFDVSDDGIFGKSTERAVINFQRSRDLIDDGAVGQPTLDALGLGDVVFLFPPEVIVADSVTTRIEDYVDRFFGQLTLSIDNSDRALDQFETTMKFASTSEANADILGTMVDAAVGLATDRLIDSVGAFTGGLTTRVINDVRDELRRASAAAESATIGNWIKDQRSAIGQARNSFKPESFRTELETDFLEAADEQEWADSLFGASEGLAAFQLPSAGDLELILYEQWINAHFRGVTGDGPGCIEFRNEFEDNRFHFVSCEVKAVEGPKVAGALNRLFDQKLTTLAELPIDLFVRKRACFRTENLVGGKKFSCGWLGIKNEVLHEPVLPLGQQAFAEDVWTRHPRFD